VFIQHASIGGNVKSNNSVIGIHSNAYGFIVKSCVVDDADRIFDHIDMANELDGTGNIAHLPV
jgi:hypothetical protein